MTIRWNTEQKNFRAGLKKRKKNGVIDRQNYTAKGYKTDNNASVKPGDKQYRQGTRAYRKANNLPVFTGAQKDAFKKRRYLKKKREMTKNATPEDYALWYGNK